MYLEPTHLTNTEINALMSGYASLINERIFTWHSKAFFLTVMFERMDMPKKVTQRSMEKELEALYSRVLTRSFRRPNKMALHDFPIWIGIPDFPVSKKSSRLRMHISNVAANGGMHFHILVSHPAKSRLDSHFHDFIDNMAPRLIGSSSKISKLHCVAIDDSEVSIVVNYGLKSLPRRRCSTDDILILPKSHSEMPDPHTWVGKQHNDAMRANHS